MIQKVYKFNKVMTGSTSPDGKVSETESSCPPLATGRLTAVRSCDPPKGWSVNDYTNYEGIETETVLVKDVILNVHKNTLDHKTHNYELTWAIKWENGTSDPATLIVRRGQSFDISVEFNRPLTEEDEAAVVLEIGDAPRYSKGTSVPMSFNLGMRRCKWGVDVLSTDGNIVNLRLNSPPDCVIGSWNLKIDTLRLNEELKSVYSYKHKVHIIIIGNPFCQYDSLYLDNEMEREEHLLSETGGILTGSEFQPGIRPWKFSQYETPVLTSALKLLETVDINSRGDVIAICRALTPLICERVVETRFDGKYQGSTAPTAWLSTISILEKWLEKEEKVRYAQCSVVSAVLSSIFKSLGIVTRLVTGFSVAHDLDSYKTLDFHWDEKGSAMSNLDSDFIWSYRVWLECYFARRDLPKGMGGWQMVDPLPRHMSISTGYAGPISVCALKKGLAYAPFGTDCAFGSLNADVVHWLRRQDGGWMKRVEKDTLANSIGICQRNPKGVTVLDKTHKHVLPLQVDISANYKFSIGSEEKRASVRSANLPCARTQLDMSSVNEIEDVKIEASVPEDLIAGAPFDVTITVQNCSRSVRNVTLTIAVLSVYYTGIRKAVNKQRVYDIELPAIKAETLTLHLTYEDYIYTLTDHLCFDVAVRASVQQTGQQYAHVQRGRLKSPELSIKIPPLVRVGVPCNLSIELENTLPVALTQCEWRVEGPGGLIEIISCRDVESYERVSTTVNMVPVHSGVKSLLASFHSAQLTGVTGIADVKIQA
ncbi:DgyrCDS4990 [Dimorphilus gyrociliatus]|uniref:DgyrCDS4990 n=1 Tax=Dimorphilus gyrociliatus TaxID=2664684 RepID=A0A7I8VKS9_9ANNE|nr:DgyrCDS4990 [Dimorphilus gyrociliatus]